MTAYAQAYVGDDSPLAADALTVSPYLGYESLRPVLELAAATGRGVFVLALTSNPEAAEPQHGPAGDGSSVAGQVVDGAPARQRRRSTPLGSVGLVVGATVGAAVHDLGLDLAAVNGPLLAPGLGAQGGTAGDLRGRLRRRPAQRPGRQQPRDPRGRTGPRRALRAAARRAAGRRSRAALALHGPSASR